MITVVSRIYCTVGDCDHVGELTTRQLLSGAYTNGDGHAVCACHPLEDSEDLDVYAFWCTATTDGVDDA